MNLRPWCFGSLLLVPLIACSGTTAGQNVDEAASTDGTTPAPARASEGACDQADCAPAPTPPAGDPAAPPGPTSPPAPTPTPTPTATTPPTPTPTPLPDCSAVDACGPELGIKTELCWDGSTAGAECRQKGPTCEWVITKCPPLPPDACGKTVCKKGQTCCEGVPFPTPTCIDGTACPK